MQSGFFNLLSRKICTKLVQINDVFLLQIKYNVTGYFSASSQKQHAFGILYREYE